MFAGVGDGCVELTDWEDKSDPPCVWSKLIILGEVSYGVSIFHSIAFSRLFMVATKH